VRVHEFKKFVKGMFEQGAVLKSFKTAAELLYREYIVRPYTRNMPFYKKCACSAGIEVS
jgi:hypothetical protein